MRPIALFCLLAIFLTGCTTYRYNWSAQNDTMITSASLDSLNTGDKLFVRLVTGQKYNARFIDVQEFSLIISTKKQELIIPFELVEVVRFDVNVPKSVIKSVLAISFTVVTFGVIFVALFPPVIGF